MEKFSQCFSDLPDPRADNALHDLTEILFIPLLATLCGAQTCCDIALFAKTKEPLLRTVLDLAYGVPSHDTFSRVFRMLDPKAFEKAFRRFMRAFAEATEGVVALDGKALGRAYEGGKSHMPPIMVTAWSAQTRMALANVLAPGNNEAAAALELVGLLTLKGCVVTTDALHCHRAMAAGDCRAGRRLRARGQGQPAGFAARCAGRRCSGNAERREREPSASTIVMVATKRRINRGRPGGRHGREASLSRSASRRPDHEPTQSGATPSSAIFCCRAISRQSSSHRSSTLEHRKRPALAARRPPRRRLGAQSQGQCTCQPRRLAPPRSQHCPFPSRRQNLPPWQIQTCRMGRSFSFRDAAPHAIALEACGAAHHWARELQALGHDVVLLPPQHVKPYVQRGKNDAADASAICEAMSRPRCGLYR